MKSELVELLTQYKNYYILSETVGVLKALGFISNSIKYKKPFVELICEETV